MNQTNKIFPISILAEVKDLLDSLDGRYKIRYRGPRKEGFNIDPVTGKKYWRSKANAMQDAIKKDATGFVVYGFKKVTRSAWNDSNGPYYSYLESFPMFPLRS
jgi:hypothetical protein